MIARTVHLLVAVVTLAAVASSCTEEKATPVDLDAVPSTAADSATGSQATDSSGTVTSGTMAPLSDEVDPDDPNAEARQQVIDAARQQCLDDPEQVEGVVRIVVADTGEVANEYRVNCDEVRAEEEG